MEKQNLPPFIPFLASALILTAMGLAGLFLLFNLTLPTLGPRWIFFFLITITASGLSLPVIYFLHWRFPSPTPVTAGIIVRQAIWVGLYFDLLAWFQMGRFLTLPLGFALAAGLAAIEFAIRLAERSRFVAGENE